MENVEEVLRGGWWYILEHVGVDGIVKSREKVWNLMPTASLNYVMNAAWKGGSQYTSFYLGLYDNNRTPLAADTMTDLAADYGENVDYTGTERLTITLPTVASGATNTVASPNEFDFTSTESIRGAFISTSPTWGGATGLLVSAVLFPSPKALVSGESLRVPCGFAIVST